MAQGAFSRLKRYVAGFRASVAVPLPVQPMDATGGRAHLPAAFGRRSEVEQ
ncbi:hypothetical protein FTUN_8414 [Frigoriglobus tundricola]|uniref:Uncharacterized protein n=1 Tax=Frigoriglobus tundricola TaxID=2774151 RepID=A0A6M5Z3U7_9BACT|nr:hypothetical protein FTUN_8414 [Frigoriglobus tundricola]